MGRRVVEHVWEHVWETCGKRVGNMWEMCGKYLEVWRIMENMENVGSMETGNWKMALEMETGSWNWKIEKWKMKIRNLENEKSKNGTWKMKNGRKKKEEKMESRKRKDKYTKDF